MFLESWTLSWFVICNVAILALTIGVYFYRESKSK